MALQGIYTGKYDPLINVPLSIPSAVSASIVPTLTAAVMNRQKKKVHYQIDQTLRIATIITIPSCVGIAVLASPLMVLLYNDSSATPAQSSHAWSYRYSAVRLVLDHKFRTARA